jgi:peroxiredoxin
MSHASRRFSLLAAAALALCAATCFAASAPPDTATAACRRHLQAIGRALKAYKRANGSLPSHLSDLYPKYLKDKATLHCPADPTPGDPTAQVPSALPDPGMPVSYLYEMSADPATFVVPFGPAPDGKVTWQQQKMAQHDYFGDRVPVVRCWHHAEVPAGQTPLVLVPELDLAGKVTRTVPGWEYDPAVVPALLTSLERDLAAGPDRLHRWSPGEIARYFAAAPSVPTLHARLHAAAEKLAAMAEPFPNASPGTRSTAIASLYGAAGEMEKAVPLYQAALGVPGFHAEVASLMIDQYFTAGQPDKAVATLENLQAKEPDSPDYTLLLAGAYERAGQPEKAAAMRRRADQQSVGQPAPDFTLKDASGKAVHLADLHGKPVLLYFWAYPDEPARAVAPQLEALKQKYQDRQLTILSLIPAARHEALDFAGKTFSYPLLINAVPAFNSYSISAVPTLVLIDRDGKVVSRHSGPLPGLETVVEEEVKKVLPAATQ